MFKSSVVARRRGIGALAAAALCATALVTTSTVSGADVRTQKTPGIDKTAVIRMGIKIGDRAVIGAGSIVTHDVPADAVVAGNPARVLRLAEASHGPHLS